MNCLKFRKLPFLFGLPFLLNIPKYGCFTPNPKVEHLAEMMIRSTRRRFLNRVAMPQQKVIINAEIRKSTDGVIDLKKQGKAPGVIHRFSKNVEEEIDIVVDGRMAKNLSKWKSFGTDTVYIRVDGKQIRCVYNQMDMHSTHFIKLAHFQQYIPGQPNELKIPIELTHLTENPFIQRGSQFDFKKEDIRVLCYNEEYPHRFTIDISFVCPQRCYRVGDLANMFPPGIILHPRQKKSNRIVVMYEAQILTEEQREQRLKEISQKNKEKAEKQKAQAAANSQAKK